MRTAVLSAVALSLAVMAMAEDATVWVASPWQQVLRDTAPGPERAVRLQAAANEYQPFRLIVHAGDRPLQGVTAFASSLNGRGGAISALNLTMYRAHYVNITEPSYRGSSRPGWYPDALIPFADPQSGEALEGATYDAAPFDVEAGQNGEIWVDLFVPPGTRPGTYRGTVTVTAGTLELARVPVQIEVWPFELPAQIAMQSNFGSLGSRVANAVGVDPASEEFARIEDLYIDELLRHRAVPGSLGDIWPDWTPDGGLQETGEADRVRMLVEEKHVNALRIPLRFMDEPEKAKAYLRDTAEWLRRLGYLDLAYVYLRDEPNNAEEYEIVRGQGALVHEADPEIARMCTEQTVTSNPEWGDLYGAVDIWCPLWGLWDEPTAKQRLALGERLWSYTALCQGPEGTPWWQIDFDPLMFRAPFWTSWHYDITGFLYWSSVYWDYGGMEGVYERPAFRDRYWGEGMLLYPGPPAGIDGPVPSIRLKLVREALEEYEYMVMAAGLGGAGELTARMGIETMELVRLPDPEQQVDEIVANVTTSFQHWSRDAADYERARRRLAEIIVSCQ
ncbi:MAG: glycoside hydrolase domain-containing protein [Armatimonadota bacterium]